jgi:hypothetical protein
MLDGRSKAFAKDERSLRLKEGSVILTTFANGLLTKFDGRKREKKTGVLRRQVPPTLVTRHARQLAPVGTCWQLSTMKPMAKLRLIAFNTVISCNKHLRQRNQAYGTISVII